MLDEQHPIRVDLVRTGGFAGVRLRASVDTGKLSTEQADSVAQLVTRLDFDALGARSEKVRPLPDQFQYDLTVTQGDRQRHLRLSESAVTPELQRLLDLIVRLARER